MKIRRISFVFALVCLCTASALATTYTWTGNGPGNNWSTTNNWSPPTGVPTTGDTATINSPGVGTVLVDKTFTVASLTAINVNLLGTGSLTVNGTVEAQHATFGPAGGTTLTGGCTMNVDPVPGNPVENTTTIASVLTVNSSVNASSNVVFAVNAGSTVVNNRFFTLADGAQLSLAASGALFVNNGSFTGGNSVCYANSSLFSNAPAGTVYANAGKNLQMQGNVANSGVFEPQGGAVMNLSTATALHDGASITGDGSVVLTGNATVDGTVTVAGNLQFNGNALTLSGGLEVQSSGYFYWLGGSLTGVGTNVTGTVLVDARGDMIINGLNTLTLRNCAINNEGVLTWTNSATLFMGYNAVIYNPGHFQITGDATLAPLSSGDPGYGVATINNDYNSSVIEKNAGATNSLTTIAVPLYCGSGAGSIGVYQGNLSLTGGGSLNYLSASANATLQLTDGNFVNASKFPSFNGQGLLTMAPGVNLMLSANCNFAIKGTFNQRGGTISGIGNISLSDNSTGQGGTFNWFAGTIALTNAVFAINISSSSTMNLQGGTGSKNFLRGRLVNNGTLNWINDNNSSGLNAGDNAVFDNFGQFNIKCDSFIGDVSLTVHPVFTNESNGVLTKSGSIGTTSIGFKLVNAGLIQAQSGTLELYQFDDSQAQYNQGFADALHISGTLKVDTATQTFGTIFGKGTISVTGGLTSSGNFNTTDGNTVQVDGNLNNDGSMNPDPGKFVISGNNFIQTTNGTLIIPIRGTNAAALEFGQLLASGYTQITLAGALVVQITNGYAPPVGATFPFLSSFQRNGTFNNVILPQGFQLNYTPYGATLVVTGAVPVQIISPAVTNGQFQFGFNTISNRSYTVQYKDDLTTGIWTFLTNFTGNGSYWQPTSPSPLVSQRYYRVSNP